MNRIIIPLVIILQIATKQNAFAQTDADKNQQFASLGNFILENGQQINDCKIGYRTFGKLVVMDSDLGHLIFNEKIPIEATRKFLAQ